MTQLVQALLFTVSLILYGILFYALAITPRVASTPADTCLVTCSDSQRLFPAVFCVSHAGCCKRQNGRISNVFINSQVTSYKRTVLNSFYSELDLHVL